MTEKTSVKEEERNQSPDQDRYCPVQLINASSLIEKRRGDVTKTKFMKLWDWLAYPNKVESVHLLKISLLLQIGEEI